MQSATPSLAASIRVTAPVLPRHVRAIRVRLEVSAKARNLALFNLATGSKLGGCDLVTLKVADVFAAGQVKERASVIQSKTRKPVRFEITEGSRMSRAAWLEPGSCGTHSMRRTKVAQIYRKRATPRAVQFLPGHTRMESTVGPRPPLAKQGKMLQSSHLSLTCADNAR